MGVHPSEIRYVKLFQWVFTRFWSIWSILIHSQMIKKKPAHPRPVKLRGGPSVLRRWGSQHLPFGAGFYQPLVIKGIAMDSLWFMIGFIMVYYIKVFFRAEDGKFNKGLWRCCYLKVIVSKGLLNPPDTWVIIQGTKSKDVLPLPQHGQNIDMFGNSWEKSNVLCQKLWKRTSLSSTHQMSFRAMGLHQ